MCFISRRLSLQTIFPSYKKSLQPFEKPRFFYLAHELLIKLRWFLI